MQKIFLKYNTLWALLFVIGMTAMGQSLWAQSQNPFEIKSRKHITTTVVDSNDTPLPSESKPIIIPDDTNERNVVTPDTTYDMRPEDSTSHMDTIRQSVIDSMYHGSENEAITEPPAKNQDKNNIFNFSKPETDSGTLGISWWYYVFDLFLLLILLGAFVYDKKIFPPLRKAFIHENFLRFLYRDTYLRKPGIFIYLNILFLLSLGFIIFRAAEYFGRAFTFREYLIIQGVLIVLFLIKHLGLHLLSRLVDKSFEVNFYQYWMILSGGLVGLWMIPLALMVSVLPFKYLYIALIISFLSICSLLIYRQFKALLHAKTFLSKHLFQYFLYFCAVEIVPAVLLADILVHY